MKYAVIGGSGFIGSRLIPELLQDGQVTNLDKCPSSGFQECTLVMDVRRLDSFSEHLKGVDTVVLLAAEHRDDVTPASLYFDVNVGGMTNVLAAMDSNGVKRLVFTSTVALYGLDTVTPPSECDMVSPFNDYGISKWEAECLIDKWVAKGEGRVALVLRPCVVFGEGNRGNVFNLLNQIHRGNFLMIGGGRNRKSMAYVGNLVAFIRFMLRKEWEGKLVFNYVDNPDLDMQTVVSMVYRRKGQKLPRLKIPYAVGMLGGFAFDILSKLTGRKFPVSSIRIKKFCANTLVDGSKLKSTGFVPPFSLLDGLNRMLNSEF